MICLFLYIFLGVFDQFENMEKINLLEGEDDLGSDSCPCSCHPAPGKFIKWYCQLVDFDSICGTAKWIWHRSIFSSIKTKQDVQLFVYFCVFPHSYLFCAENFYEHRKNTIFGAKQVIRGENTQVNKQLCTIYTQWFKMPDHLRKLILRSDCCTL